jgi:hypothetical protein
MDKEFSGPSKTRNDSVAPQKAAGRIAIDHLQLAMPQGGEAEARRFYADLALSPLAGRGT